MTDSKITLEDNKMKDVTLIVIKIKATAEMIITMMTKAIEEAEIMITMEETIIIDKGTMTIIIIMITAEDKETLDKMIV